MQTAVTFQADTHGAAAHTRAAAFLELTKPGITRLVVLTAGAGFYLGAKGTIDFPLLVATLIGTALTASSANALNQCMERDADALMHRTQNRPLPSGRLSLREAVVFAVTTGLAGLLMLALVVNVLTAAVVAACLLSYVLVYTPLKRITSLSTLVGAVPGALPAVAGWTAATGRLEPGAWALFWILFVWQIPHFLALAWMYRDDYRRGGFRMLTLGDADGRRTGRQAFLYALALLPVSLTPTLLGITGPVYFIGAFVLSIALLFFGAQVMFQRQLRDARRLFLASVIYLPVLLVLMIVDTAAR